MIDVPLSRLPDPYKDRVANGIPRPPNKPIEDPEIFKYKGKPNYLLIKEVLYEQGFLSKNQLKKIIQMATALFKKEGNLIEIEDPVNIVGDLHGHYYDLYRLMIKAGDPLKNKYLFLGDYVNRGFYSLEILIYLYALKINFKKTVFLLRGNHETSLMTKTFNFHKQCVSKYDQEIYDMIIDSFNHLPIACLLNGKILCIHAGISPGLKTLNDIKELNRVQEPQPKDMVMDLLWSDPCSNKNGELDRKKDFEKNKKRKCSYVYSRQAVNKFLSKNGLVSIIRSHEVCKEGYVQHKWKGNFKVPQVITIFSAPNYCDIYQNKASYLKFNNNNFDIYQFVYQTHPYLLPNDQTLFDFSIEFIIQATFEFIAYWTKPLEKMEINDDDPDFNDPEFKKFLKKLDELGMPADQSEVQKKQLENGKQKNKNDNKAGSRGASRDRNKSGLPTSDTSRDNQAPLKAKRSSNYWDPTVSSLLKNVLVKDIFVEKNMVLQQQNQARKINIIKKNQLLNQEGICVDPTLNDELVKIVKKMNATNYKPDFEKLIELDDKEEFPQELLVKMEDDLPPKHSTPKKNRQSVNMGSNNTPIQQRRASSINSSRDTSMIR